MVKPYELMLGFGANPSLAAYFLKKIGAQVFVFKKLHRTSVVPGYSMQRCEWGFMGVLLQADDGQVQG